MALGRTVMWLRLSAGHRLRLVLNCKDVPAIAAVTPWNEKPFCRALVSGMFCT